MDDLNVTASSRKLFQLQRKIQETEKKNPRRCRNFQRLLYRTSELQLLIIQKILQIQFKRYEKTAETAKPQVMSPSGFEERALFRFQETRTIQFGHSHIFFSKLVSKEYRYFLKRQILNILWVFALSPIVENKKTGQSLILTGLKSSQVYKMMGLFLQKPWIQYIIISQFSNFFNKKNKLWILSNLLIERKFFLHWFKSEKKDLLSNLEPWRFKYIHHEKTKTLSLKTTLENWIHFHFMNSYLSPVIKFDKSLTKFSHLSPNDHQIGHTIQKFPVLDKGWILNDKKIFDPGKFGLHWAKPQLAAKAPFQKLLLLFINGNLGARLGGGFAAGSLRFWFPLQGNQPSFYNLTDKTIRYQPFKNWGFAQLTGNEAQGPPADAFAASVSNLRYPTPLAAKAQSRCSSGFAFGEANQPWVRSADPAINGGGINRVRRADGPPMLTLFDEKRSGSHPSNIFKLTHDGYFRKFFLKRQKGHQRISLGPADGVRGADRRSPRNKVLGEAEGKPCPRRHLFQNKWIEYSGFLLLPLTTKKNLPVFHHYAKMYGLHIKFIKLYSLDQGIHFLGWFWKKNGDHLMGAISHANIQNHQKELKLYLKISAHQPIDGIISELNKKIFYWQKFYNGSLQLSNGEAARMNDYLFWRIWYWLKKRHRNRGSMWLYNRYWKKSIYRKWIFSDNNYTLISYNL